MRETSSEVLFRKHFLEDRIRALKTNSSANVNLAGER
jgi:hypothetical protein